MMADRNKNAGRPVGSIATSKNNSSIGSQIGEDTSNILSRIRRLGTLYEAINGRAVDTRYRYLERILRFSQRWSHDPYFVPVAGLLQIEARRTDRVSALIETLLAKTSCDDRRLRSKHGRALKYVAARNVRSRDAVAFIKRQGGLNACADRFGRLRDAGKLA